MQAVLQNKPLEMEIPLNNGKNITLLLLLLLLLIFYIQLDWEDNILCWNCSSFFFQLSEKHA